MCTVVILRRTAPKCMWRQHIHIIICIGSQQAITIFQHSFQSGNGTVDQPLPVHLTILYQTCVELATQNTTCTHLLHMRCYQASKTGSPLKAREENGSSWLLTSGNKMIQFSLYKCHNYVLYTFRNITMMIT